jgi:hypothetical protein
VSNIVGRSRLDEDKKDTIGFGNLEVSSDLGKRFWWGGRTRLAMTEVN